MNTEKKMKVIFAPGALDDFEGTQEELDKLVAEINELAESGELFEMSRPIDEDELMEDEELQDVLEDVIKTLINSNDRKLH